MRTLDQECAFHNKIYNAPTPRKRTKINDKSFFQYLSAYYVYYTSMDVHCLQNIESRTDTN